MFPWGLVILAAVVLIAVLSMIRATRAFNAQRASLDADERKTLDEHLRQTSRADLPSRIKDVAAQAVRVRRTYFTGMLAILAGIVYVIIVGPF